MNTILKLFWRGARRKWLIKFRQDYVSKQIANRKGKCKRCGCCDAVPKIFRCKWFKPPNTCIIWKKYGFLSLPKECKLYPIDEKDKNEFSKKHCAFHWKK